MRRKNIIKFLLIGLVFLMTLVACSANNNIPQGNNINEADGFEGGNVSDNTGSQENNDSSLPESQEDHDNPIPEISGESIIDLLEQNKIEVKVTGSQIDKVIVELRKLVEESLEVEISTGTYFVSQSSGVQNMVTRHSVSITLNTDAWKKLVIEAACANIELEVPGSGDSFTVMEHPSKEELGKLMAVLDSASVSYDVEQAAIWIVTDNADYGDLGTLVSGSVGGFGGERSIDEGETAYAMMLIDQAGIEIRGKRIWRDWATIKSGVKDRNVLTRLEEIELTTTKTVDKSISLIYDVGGVFDISPDGSMLATGSEGGIIIWDVSTLDSMYEYTDFGGWPESLIWFPQGDMLAVSINSSDLGNPASDVFIIDVLTGDIIQEITGVNNWYVFMDVSPQGNYLALSSCGELDVRDCVDPQILIWDVNAGELIQTLTGSDYLILGIPSFSPDGKYLATWDFREVWIWEVMTGKRVYTFEIDTPKWVDDLSWSSTGKLAVYYCSKEEGYDCVEHEISIWEPPFTNETDVYTLNFTILDGAAWHPDGYRIVLSGCVEGEWDDCIPSPLLLLDTNSGEILEGLQYNVSNIKISPDGSYMAGYLLYESMLIIIDGLELNFHK